MFSRRTSASLPGTHGWSALLLLCTAVAGVGNGAAASGLGVPGPFPTIQAAIDAAKDGDEIVVADGLYRGAGNKNLDFAGKSITLRSAGGAKNCVIDCEYSGRGFYFHSGETENAVIDGFTVANGRIISANVPGGPFGAGVHIAGCGPVVRNCTFINNSIEVEGSRRGGGLYTEEGNPKIIDCVFIANSVNALSMKLVAGPPKGSGIDGGGGLYVQAGSPTIENCHFDSNTTDGHGGAIASSGQAIVNNCSFSGNFAYAGGAIMIDHGGGSVTDCSFEGNQAQTFGGAAYLLATTLNIDRSTFLDNQGSGGGALEIFGISSNPAITACSFVGNQAVSGAAVRVFQASSTFLNCLFVGNEANNQGGAVRTVLGSSDLINCCFTKNSANVGGSLSTGELSQTNVVNSILWDNLAKHGSQIALETGARKAKTAIAHCDVQGGEAAVHVPIDATLEWGKGNIDLDPLFADLDGADDNISTLADNNYRLSFTSPCVDQGDDLVIPEGWPLDLDGIARFHNHPASPNNGDSVVDLGPFEFYAVLGDVDGNGVVNVDDLVQVIVTWGGCLEEVCPADLTGDGAVASDDLLLVINNWTL